MPFDEEEDNLEPVKKIGLKQVSSRRSIFDNTPKKPSQEDFEKQVQDNQEKMMGYKQRAADLTVQFKKIIEDKTLSKNKNIFSKELEKEILTKMVNLAVEINNDPNEQEGMGSLSWITLLFKISLRQRDKINDLEYELSLLQKKLEPSELSKIISQEIERQQKENKNG